MEERVSRQLINSQEEERRRIVRELHDGLGQHLLFIKDTRITVEHKLISLDQN